MGYSVQQLSGVSTASESGSGWNDDNSGTLWGWLGSIVDGLESVWENITNLPQKIAEKLVLQFGALKTGISDLGTTVLDGIKGIFIPDMAQMKAEFKKFTNKLKPATGDDIDSLGGIAGIQETEPVDISSDITIGDIQFSNIKFLDLSYFKQGVKYFRPVINAFLGWLLIMFYYNEFLSFIGQGPVYTKARSEYETHKTADDNPNVRGRV